MGFKRGWRAFKASNSKPAESMRRVSRSTPFKRAVVNQMAKRRRGGFRRSARGRGSSLNAMDGIVYGGGYGALQPKLYDLAAKTGFNPRLVCGLAGWAAFKYGSGPIKKLGYHGLSREAGSQAQAMTAGMFNASGNGGGVVLL